MRYFKLLVAAIVAATTVTVRSTPPPAASPSLLPAGGQRATKSSCLSESSRVPVPGVRKKAAGRASNLLVKSSRRTSRDEEKFFTDRTAAIRILQSSDAVTMYSRSWAHNLSARMGLEVRALGDNEPP